MTETDGIEIDFEIEDFDFRDMDEELRVTERCQTLLNGFYKQLLLDGYSQESASDLAYKADFYIRDYLVDFARQNVVSPKPGVIGHFAANWFITHTLDPDMESLEKYLAAIREFYRFLCSRHFIDSTELSALETEAGNFDYYKTRIDDFTAICGEGYAAWEASGIHF